MSSHGGMSFGILEIVCLGVLMLLAIVAFGSVVMVAVRLANKSRDDSALKPRLQKQGPQPVLADAVSHIDVVAKIAKRFCPKCRAVLTSDSPEGLCPACLLAGGLSDVSPVDPSSASAGSSDKPPAAEVAQLLEELPNLEILELLGQGGMGAVYKARQKNLDRLVAVKVIRPDNAADPAFMDRFEREAKSLAKLNHANIVTVHDFGRAGDICYLVMEFIDGVNLRQTMRAGRLSPREALAIVPQICDALQYAHDHGIVHRDIKPENVLLDRWGRIKIADFGLAKLLGIDPDSMTLTLTQHVVGTPRYMAPEQIERPTEVDHRADIYSLGVVIYEMLTGELPVGHFPLPSERVQVDVKIDEVVLRALAKEPEKRFQKASQVKSHLASAESWPSPPPKLLPVVAELRQDPATQRERARRLVKGPAMGLMATGVLGIVPLVAAIFVTLAVIDARHNTPPRQQFASAVSRVCQARAIDDNESQWSQPRATTHQNQNDQNSGVSPLAIGLIFNCGSSVASLTHPTAFSIVPPILAAEEGFVSNVRPTWMVMIGGPLLLLTAVPSLMIVAGGWQMRQLESYGLAMISAIMALIPICTLGFPLGIPMGIWALIVLSRRDVREAFGS